MTDNEIAYWSLVVAAFSGIFGIGAVVVAVRALRVSRDQFALQQRTTIAEGTFDRPALMCCPLREGCPDRVIIAVKIPKRRVAEVQFPFVIKNTGTKTAEHVTIYFRFPKELAYNNALVETKMKEPWVSIKKIETAFVPEENFSTVVMSVPRLATHEQIVLSLPISLRRGTEITNSVVANTKDNVPVQVTYKLLVNYIFNIFAACEGAPPYSRQHTIDVIDTSNESLAEAINRRNKNMWEQSEYRQKKMTRFERFMEPMKFIWNKDYKKDWLPKVYVFETSEKDKRSDKTAPIDRYASDHATICEGAYSVKEKTYWIPAAGTTFFGRTEQ